MQNDLINPGLRAGAVARSSSEREAGSMQSFPEDCYPSRRKVAGTGAAHGSAHGSMHVFPPVYDDHARSHRFDVTYSGYDPHTPNVMAAAPPVNLPLAAESDHALNYGMMGMRVKHPRTRAHSPYRYTGLESSTAGPECMQGQEVLPHHFPFPAGKHTFGSGAVPELPPGSHHDTLTELARENIILKHQLNAAAMEVERLKHTIEGYNHSYCHEGRSGGSGKSQSRYWTEEEHQRFLDAIQNYGHKDVKAIAQVVGTRSATQVRTHAQKYFIKLARSRKESQSSGKPMQDTHSNPDQEDMADDPTEEEMSGTSMEAAAAAAAAAWEAGTSAAAAAAYVAASQSKSASKKAAAAAAAAAAEDVKTGSSGSSSGSSNHGNRSNLVSSNVHSLNDESIKCKSGKNTKTSMRGRKRSNPDRDGPGTPGSMGSSNGSLGSSDATGSSTGNGSNGSSGGSNGVRSSDTTNGGENGSSNGSNSNGCNENGSSGDPGSSGDSGGNSCGDSGGNSGGDSGGNSPRRCRNNGVSSNDGSDHGFFDTGEEGEPFSDELANEGSDELVNEGSDELVNEGSDELANEGGSSEEGYLENALSAGSPVAQTFR